MLSMIVELLFLFAALYIVNKDVEKNSYGKIVLWMWVLATAILYFFIGIIGVVAILLIYFGFTRLFIGKQHGVPL
ncbi:MAG: hypothetical protein R6U17_01430 [Thermoplasmata archaeon]